MKKSDHTLELLLDTSEKQAVFQFPEYAKVIANAIIGTKPQFTIGIFGLWGKGKTTLLELINKELSKHDQVVVVPFDAWRYQHETHMIIPMLDALQEVLKDHKGVLKNMGETIGKLAKAFLYATTVKLQLADLNLKEGINAFDDETKSQYYQWHLTLGGAINEAREVKPNARIVFLIDDLDRCLPHKAIQVLETIKVMFDVEGFVFVIGLDRQVLENAVEAHYGKEYGIRGRDYIKKLVQVEFTLPPIRRQDLRDYMDGLQVRLPTISQNVIEVLKNTCPFIAQDNPREVKRFVNSTLIASAIASESGVDAPDEAQVVLMAIKFRWPEFAEQISEQPGIVASIAEYIEGTRRLHKEAAEAIRTIIQKHVGLEEFIRLPVAAHLLRLPRAKVEQILFFTKVVESTESTLDESTVIHDLRSRITEEESEPFRRPTQYRSRFDKFTERARKAIALSMEEARRLNHSYIGPEHLLLGLSQMHDGVAFKILLDLRVDIGKLRSATENLIGSATQKTEEEEIGLTPKAKRVIELSLDSARSTRCNYVGTEHILMGLLAEGENIAAGVLQSFGITFEDVVESFKTKFRK